MISTKKTHVYIVIYNAVTKLNLFTSLIIYKLLA